MVDVSSEYEFCDVMHTFRSNSLDFDCTRFIYIPKTYYDAQVKCGQETAFKVQQQAAKDIPRCHFEFQGQLYDHLPHDVSVSLARYCTQAVMAVPVEMLSRFGLVAEQSPPTPLKIRLWGSRAFITKELRLFATSFWLPIKVAILVNEQDPVVVVKISSRS